MTDKPASPEKETDGTMPFLRHLEELRWRILKSIVAVIVMAMAAFYFADKLILFIKRPFGDTPLYNIQVTGTFYAYLKISLFTGIIAALPVVFYQLWSFISPGLYRKEKAWILPMVAISTLLFLIGAAFCFVVVLPISFKFLMGFAGDLIQNT
ncbi:MAG: twin-arginine translocase subunit TatC, partial [Phycisphaerales bacterium]